MRDIFFFFLEENICYYVYSLEAPHLGSSNEYPQHVFFVQEISKLGKYCNVGPVDFDHLPVQGQVTKFDNATTLLELCFLVKLANQS